MKHGYISPLIMALLLLSGCNDRDVFEKEQYKNIFGFVSESDNTKETIVSLQAAETTTYMSISMGGTIAPSKDVKIQIVEDQSLIDDYNKTNYDVDVAKYSVALPEGKYEIMSNTCTVKAGEFQGSIPVKIIPEGLSPDKDYMIPVRVHSFDGAEMHPDKSTLLMKIGLKNQWANSNGVSFSMVGTRKTMPDGSPINMPGTKTVHSLTSNSVRVMPGNIVFSSDIHDLEAYAMVLQVNMEGVDGYHKVTIKPYRDLKIEQIDGDADYPNTYAIIDDGFNTYKTFLLHYYYTVGTDKFEMKEELRVNYEEDAEVDEGFEVVTTL